MPQYSWQTPQIDFTPQGLQEAVLRFQSDGPCLNVEVHVPDALAEVIVKGGGTVPPPLSVRALLDSGATRTAIDRDYASTLGLVPVGNGLVQTPSGSEQQHIYGIKVEFPTTNLPVVPFIFAFGAQLKDQGIGVLLGRDYLLDKVMIFNGPMRLITLCF